MWVYCYRGFETCSIMLEGRMQHQDSAGNKVRTYARLVQVVVGCFNILFKVKLGV